MTPAELHGSHGLGTPRCTECDARLAHDQRYCLRCGARRGPLPAAVAAVLGELRTRGQAAVAVPAPPAAEPREPPWRAMPSARPVSLALMAMLAFGVVVGSVTGTGGAATLADSLVVTVSPATHRVTVAAVPPSSAAAPSAGSSSASAPSAATPAPPQQQQTITVEASPTPTTSTTGPTTSPSTGLLGLPPIKHVFEIVLSDQGYNRAFVKGSGHPYLSTTLRKQGELIADYYAVAGSPLANEIALVSGQGPTQQTAADCPSFTDITSARKGSEAQVLGDGCLYPASTLTLADQLSHAGDRWRAYVQGIEDGPKGQPASCRHPGVDAADADQTARPGDAYVTWRNPFVYFHSLLDSNACRNNDVGIGRLAKDLQQVKTTPQFSYIAASPCDDGSDQPCLPGARSGLAAADTFLKSVVPEIERSAAYKQDGLIAITFDGAPQTGPFADSSSCCDNPAYPNLPKGSAGSGTPAAPSVGTAATVETTSTTDTTSATDTTDTTDTSEPTSTPTTSSATATTSAGTTTSTTSPSAPADTTPTTTTPATAPAAGPTPTPTTNPAPGAPATTPATTTSATTTTPASTTTGTTTPTLPGATPPGGGQVGLLLISRYVKPGSLDAVDTYNHYSLLKSIEDLFGLKALGYAADPALPVFDAAIFNAKTS